MLPRHAGGDGRPSRHGAARRRLPRAERTERRACRHEPRARSGNRLPVPRRSHGVRAVHRARACRFLVETGQTEADLAVVAVAQRAYAERNERAYLRAPHSIDADFAAPYVAEPFRVPDCTVEVDGACAVVVSTLEDAARPRATADRATRRCLRGGGRGRARHGRLDVLGRPVPQLHLAARRRPVGVGRARACPTSTSPRSTTVSRAPC